MENAGKKKILLIDDSQLHLNLTMNMLKDDYEVFTAKSGKVALALLCNNLVPDLILLDIIMPQMDGWGMFKAIKGISMLNNVPIAFMTSVSDATDAVKAFSTGAADFIRKPCDKDTLIQRIENIFSRMAAQAGAGVSR